jgi:predicted secreted protein
MLHLADLDQKLISYSELVNHYQHLRNLCQKLGIEKEDGMNIKSMTGNSVVHRDHII